MTKVDIETSCGTPLERHLGPVQLSSGPWMDLLFSFHRGWGGISVASVALGMLSGGFGLRLWSKLWGPDHCSRLDVCLRQPENWERDPACRYIYKSLNVFGFFQAAPREHCRMFLSDMSHLCPPQSAIQHQGALHLWTMLISLWGS